MADEAPGGDLIDVFSRRRRAEARAAKDGARPTFVVKLGGAALTKKDELETVSPRWEEVIRAVCGVYRDADLVLVHGAGSFGHFQAHEYGLSAGNKHPAAHIGIAECRRSVCALNQSLVASLVAAGLPAVSVSPFPTWRTRGRRLVSHGADSIRELMRAGLVPVLHGDVVLDGAQGCAILSGDTIVQTLCAHLRPRRGVFVTDVDGVYTSPPGSEGASLIGCIRVPPSGHCPEALRVRSSTAAHDSTGGLDTKLAAAVAIVASEAVRALAEEDKGEEPHSFSVGGVLDFAVSVVGISALERACQAGPLAKLLGVTGTHFVPQLSSGRDDD